MLNRLFAQTLVLFRAADQLLADISVGWTR